MKYTPPTVEAIDAEVARLKPRYEAFMKASNETPDDTQLRAWAEENLREQIILETDAAKAKQSVNDLLQSIANAAPRVTIEDARKVYKAHPENFVLPERVRARHIVIHRDVASAAEATTKLLNLRTKLLTGELSWDDAVRSTSSCPNNSDLGFFKRGMMYESFEDAAFAAAEETITDVVETPLGWHLIHVIAHLPEEQALFEEVKETLMGELQTQADREAIEAYVDARKGDFA